MKMEVQNEVDLFVDMDRNFGISANFGPIGRWEWLATESSSTTCRVDLVVPVHGHVPCAS